jgi:hypothetical protein
MRFPLRFAVYVLIGSPILVVGGTLVACGYAYALASAFGRRPSRA